MPVTRFETEQLDQATLDYLHQVVQNQGHGMPGLYFDADEAKLHAPYWPIWAVCCGGAILLFTLLLAVGSTRDPVPVALFLTGGLLLGGWLVVAWMRNLIARQTGSYIGFFKYVDARYIWLGQGTGVEVESIELLTDTEALGARLRIDKADGDTFIDLRSTASAAELEDFLKGLLSESTGPGEGEDAQQRRATAAAARGYAVKERLEEESRGSERAVTSVPTPHRARSSRGLFKALVLAATVVLLFFGCLWLATYWRDGALYEAVQDKDPAHLRLYLADPRNTRFREDVINRLRSHHDLKAAEIENRPGDKQLVAGLAELVRAVGGETRPVITVAFTSTEKGPQSPEGYLSKAVLTTLNHQNLRAIREMLQPLARVQGFQYPNMPAEPIDLIEFGHVLEEPAMMTFTAKVDPGDKVGRTCKLTWTIKLQADPNSPPHTTTCEQSSGWQGDDATASVRTLYGSLSNALRQKLP